MRVLLVEDHPLMRTAVVSLLEREFGPVAATFAGTGKEAESVKGRWDLILLDHQLPDARGLDLLPWLVSLGPVLVLTTYADAGLADLARERGARGYVAKGDDPSLLLAAVKDILAGGGAFALPEDADIPPKFSRQEQRVLDGLLHGESAVEMAGALSVAPTTVQSYKNRLFSKLGVVNTAELVRKAASKGWI
jgi:two-component system, NarL family, invasion response regulator UvrY